MFAFNFKPMTDEELNNVFLLPKGEYDFSVHDFQLRTSKSGNPMIELQIRILDGNVTHTIFDYLVNTPASQFKVKNFCYAVGKGDEYEKGSLNPDRSWLGMRGKCKVDIQDGKFKDGMSGEKWPAKNVISDYIRRGENNEAQINAPQGLVLPVKEKKGIQLVDDKDIPF